MRGPGRALSPVGFTSPGILLILEPYAAVPQAPPARGWRVDDIAAFLGAHPPFDAMGPGDVAGVASVTKAQTVPAGTTIFAQGRRR